MRFHGVELEPAVPPESMICTWHRKAWRCIGCAKPESMQESLERIPDLGSSELRW